MGALASHDRRNLPLKQEVFPLTSISWGFPSSSNLYIPILNPDLRRIRCKLSRTGFAIQCNYISISPSWWSDCIHHQYSRSFHFFPSSHHCHRIIEVAMANQPGRRQPFRFWYWANPTPARPSGPSRRPPARAPPRTPPPSAAAPSPSRRPSKPSPTPVRPPSPTKEASQLQKEAATQEVSPVPSLTTLPVSQPESPTKEPVEPEAQVSRPTVEALSQPTEQPQPLPARPEPQEQSLAEPAPQPPGAGSQTIQVSEPETVSADTVLGTTPTQDLVFERERKEIKEEKSITSEEESKKELLPQVEKKSQIDTESKQDGEPSQLPPVEEKLQIDTESKQDSKLIEVTSHIPQVEGKSTIEPELVEETQPSHIPQEDKKPEEIIEEKPTTELEVIKKTEHEELIEETQPSQIPQEKEKPEEIIEEKPKTELEIIKKTEHEELIEETQPSQIPREKEKPEIFFEEKSKKELEVIKTTEHEELIEETQPSQIPQEEEKPEEIIEEKPTTGLEVIKKTEPRSPKSETASEEKIIDEPSDESSDESKDTIEIELSIPESDSEAPRPHPGARELMTKLRSSMKQINLDDSKGRESIIGTRRIPWASPSHGERASLHKEINEGISKLVQKLKLGQSQQLGSESAVSIITLSGENNGATMFVGHGTTKKESVLHNNKKAEASSGNKEIQKQMLNHSDGENPAITASINSNVQGINNSLLHESSCSEEDPGVHLVLSVKPNEKSKEGVESSAASKAPA